MTIFELDVRMAYESCKNLPMEISDNTTSDGGVTARKKRRRRSKLEIALAENAQIDIEENPETRFVHLARRSDITMFDSEPVIWQRPDVFHEEGEHPPIDFSKEHFINWSDQLSIQSSKSSQTLQRNEKISAMDPNLLDEELPPFPLPEAFLNMDRETFLAGEQTIDQRSLPRPSLEIRENELITNREPSPKRPRTEQDADGYRRTEQTQVRANVPDVTQAPVLQPSLELSALHEEDGATDMRPMRRKRVVPVKDTDDFTISYESMKALQQDYSSLLKKKEELLVNVRELRRPTVEELLLPYPAYAGKRFPVACRELYRTHHLDKMTYEQAIAEDLLAPIDRGPADQLWRYQRSSSESSMEKSEDRIVPGILFVTGTPDRFRSDRRHRPSSTSTAQIAQRTLTPGLITATATPQRPHGSLADEGAIELSNFMPLDALPRDADTSLPVNGRFRESRSSNFEFARQMGRGTNEFERRPSSVQLIDPPVPPMDSSQQPLPSSSGRGVALSPYSKELFFSEGGRHLISALAGTDRFVALSKIIPPSTTSRKRAVTVFSTLLSLLGKDMVEAEQSDAYGEIWIRGCSPQNSSLGESNGGN
ncbi:hypothetical protein KIN20_016638 [Parelaphostrongylus tenuis]|uniref:Rad21/Rec8-like protein C-terminal eukaryotic domain-containing protein n=2 Tax=Parelaphostrongylus tenuis TaxID=148309 RepID=A0AAD5MHM5_PARTN|nr:hypothetical protein KIN20_016638 [Parelaphostrongylus tenuis]